MAGMYTDQFSTNRCECHSCTQLRGGGLGQAYMHAQMANLRLQMDAAINAERERCIQIVRECDDHGNWTADLVAEAILATKESADVR